MKMTNKTAKELIFEFKVEKIFKVMKKNDISISKTDLEKLLKENIITTSCIEENTEETILTVYIKLNNENIIKELLQEQEILDIINVPVYNVETNRCHDFPITIACSEGNLNIVKLLLDKGAKKTFNKSIRCSANVNDYEEVDICLAEACIENNLECVRLLLQYGADPDMLNINKHIGEREFPLRIACEEGYLEIVKELLKTNKIFVNRPSRLFFVDKLCEDVVLRGGIYIKILKELLKAGLLKQNIKEEFDKDIKMLKRLNIVQLLVNY